MVSSAFWKADTTDSLGRFHFSNLPAGRYRLTVRRVALPPSRDSITVPPDRGIRVEAALQSGMYDGACSGYIAIEVPKPWWKFW